MKSFEGKQSYWMYGNHALFDTNTDPSKDVHDEVISLNIQLNMSEQKAKDLTTENKELIDRWMARKGHEAEEMNKTLHDQLNRR